MSDRDEIDREWSAKHSGHDAATLSITDEGIEISELGCEYATITDTRTLVDIRDTLDRLIRRRQDDDQEPVPPDPVPPDPVVTLPADPDECPAGAVAGESMTCGRPRPCPNHDDPGQDHGAPIGRQIPACRPDLPAGHPLICSCRPAALVRVGRPDGPEIQFQIPPEATILTYLQLDANGVPVVRLPFHQHGRSLHTICSLVNPENVTPVEW